MAADSLTYVLGILRRLKSTPNLNLAHPPIAYLCEWAGTQDRLVIGKLAIAIQENLSAANQIVTASNLTEEAKAGLLETIGTLKNAFAFESLNAAMQSYISSIDPAITNFAIVTSSLGLVIPEEATNEISKFLVELQSFLDGIDDFEMPIELRETAKRHIFLVIAMLNNVQAVGIEPAMSAYYDMILALRKEKTSSSDEKSASPFWDKIKKWSERLLIINKSVETGGRLISKFDDIPLLGGF